MITFHLTVCDHSKVACIVTYHEYVGGPPFHASCVHMHLCAWFAASECLNDGKVQIEERLQSHSRHVQVQRGTLKLPAAIQNDTTPLLK